MMGFGGGGMPSPEQMAEDGEEDARRQRAAHCRRHAADHAESLPPNIPGLPGAGGKFPGLPGLPGFGKKK